MSDHKDKIHTPFGEIGAASLTTGGLGAGRAATDTGGLDADGNEFGAVRPGTDDGKTEAKRAEDAEAAARTR